MVVCVLKGTLVRDEGERRSEDDGGLQWQWMEMEMGEPTGTVHAESLGILLAQNIQNTFNSGPIESEA